MASYGVSVDLSELLNQNSGLIQQLYPLLAQAVASTAEMGAYQWKDSIHKAHLWEKEKAEYVESIKWKMTGSYSAEIYSDYEKAHLIEDGRPAYDQKRALLTSQKTRVVKHGPRRGMRYLIIPFRHNTPTESGEGALAPQMPPEIYELAKDLKASSILPAGTVKAKTRLSASGYVVAQTSYSWGDQLPAGLMPKLKDHHKSDPYAGMVRFNTAPNGSKLKKSAYLTFRIMGEWSHGWITKAKPGLKLADKVAIDLQKTLEDNVGQAVTLGMLRK